MATIPTGSRTLFARAIKLLEEWGWTPFLDVRKGYESRGNGHKAPQVQTSIMFHHTAGAATPTSYLVAGDPGRGLPGPLANIHVDQLEQRIRILAAGPASHAGNGTRANYDRMLAGKAPLSGDMTPSRPDGSWSANRYSVGVEVDGVGGPKEWTDWTHHAVLAVAVAFEIAGGWSKDGKAPRVWSHKEHTYRKPGDPYMNMGAFRTKVQAAIAAGTVPPTGDLPEASYPLGKRVLSKDGTDSGPDVVELIKLLNARGYGLKEDGLFGPAVEAAVKDYQGKNGLTVDGKVGPLTAAALTGDKLPEPQPEPEPPKPTGPKLPSGAVIIVAGSANKPGGGQSSKQKRRLDVALKYLNANPGSKIVVTGGVKPGRGNNSEAEEARLYLRGKGIAANRIVKENSSGSTYGNFMSGLPIAKKAGAKSVFVISDFSHMRRCVALAYASNKARGTGLSISGVAWYKDGDRQDATVSQAAQQARVAWPDMTSDLVQSLDSRWGITSARLLRQGDRGEDVKALQKKLGVTADGIFGPDTAKAVKALQKKHGLTVDGIVGPKTLAALK